MGDCISKEKDLDGAEDERGRPLKREGKRPTKGADGQDCQTDSEAEYEFNVGESVLVPGPFGCQMQGAAEEQGTVVDIPGNGDLLINVAGFEAWYLASAVKKRDASKIYVGETVLVQAAFACHVQGTVAEQGKVVDINDNGDLKIDIAGFETWYIGSAVKKRAQLKVKSKGKPKRALRRVGNEATSKAEKETDTSPKTDDAATSKFDVGESVLVPGAFGCQMESTVVEEGTVVYMNGKGELKIDIDGFETWYMVSVVAKRE